MYYEWILWFHIISLISWFAVLFYLPRLFVYHAENIDNSNFVDVVRIQEMKLSRFIGIPSMWATVISGGLLMAITRLSETWLFVKIALVVALMIYFYSLERYRKMFLDNRCTKSGKYFRYYNEVPTILMFFIVGMVIFKPF